MVIISVPVETASPSLLYLQSSCAKTSLTACCSMMILMFCRQDYALFALTLILYVYIVCLHFHCLLAFDKVLLKNSTTTTGCLTAVRNCCNRINEQHLYSSSLSLASTCMSRDTLIPSSSSWSSSSSASPPSVTSRQSAVCSSSSIAASNCSSVISSIDTELLDVQRRLVFPKHIPVSMSVCLLQLSLYVYSR